MISTCTKQLLYNRAYGHPGWYNGKLDKQTFTSEFDSHWVPHSYSLEPHLSKGLSKLLMVNKLDKQTFTNEFESHWVPHPCSLVPHLSKKLSKLQPFIYQGTWAPRVVLMVSKLDFSSYWLSFIIIC